MKYLCIIAAIAFSVAAYSQKTNNMILKKYKLPGDYEAYVKAEPFIELFERAERYKSRDVANEVELSEISFEGFTDRATQECAFTERIYGRVKKKFTEWNIQYYYVNQRLREKYIQVYEKLAHVKSISILFHHNGNLRSIESRDVVHDITTTVGRWDENGTPVDLLKIQETSAPSIKSKFGTQVLLIPDLHHIRMLPKSKLVEIEAQITNLLKGDDLNKLYEDYTLEDWKRFNSVRDYLNGKLTMLLYPEKDIYYRKMGAGLRLIDEYGNTYDIGDYERIKKEWIDLQIIEGPTEDHSTYINFFQNGNISAVRQYMTTKDHIMIYVGLVADYREDGSVIREINLEETFKLTSYEALDILMKAAGNSVIFNKNGIHRYVNTNHGNVWEIPYSAPSGVKNFMYVEDATKTVYGSIFKKYTKEEYKKLYPNTDPAKIEEQQNIRILVYEDLSRYQTVEH